MLNLLHPSLSLTRRTSPRPRLTKRYVTSSDSVESALSQMSHVFDVALADILALCTDTQFGVLRERGHVVVATGKPLSGQVSLALHERSGTAGCVAVVLAPTREVAAGYFQALLHESEDEYDVVSRAIAREHSRQTRLSTASRAF